MPFDLMRFHYLLESSPESRILIPRLRRSMSTSRMMILKRPSKDAGNVVKLS